MKKLYALILSCLLYNLNHASASATSTSTSSTNVTPTNAAFADQTALNPMLLLIQALQAKSQATSQQQPTLTQVEEQILKELQAIRQTGIVISIAPVKKTSNTTENSSDLQISEVAITITAKESTNCCY